MLTAFASVPSGHHGRELAHRRHLCRRGWKSKIKTPAGSVCGEGLRPRWPSTLSSYSRRDEGGPWGLFLKGTNPVRSGGLLSQDLLTSPRPRL